MWWRKRYTLLLFSLMVCRGHVFTVNILLDQHNQVSRFVYIFQFVCRNPRETSVEVKKWSNADAKGAQK